LHQLRPDAVSWQHHKDENGYPAGEHTITSCDVTCFAMTFNSYCQELLLLLLLGA
jgi:hypothetical protein